MYLDLQASIMRFCNDFKLSMGTGIIPEFVNFDSSWDDAELPNGHCIGYMGLTFGIDDQLVEGSVQIGYTTQNDTNLHDLSRAIDVLVKRLLPTNKLKIYDASTGAEKGYMVILNGTRVMAVAGSKSRPVQFVAIQFATTTTYKLDGNIQEFL